MKSLKTKLIVSIVLIFEIFIIGLCGFSYIQAKANMTNIADLQAREKIDSDMKTFERYIVFKYDNIRINKNGEMTNAKGVPIEDDYTLITIAEDDMGDLATIFKLEGDNYIRALTNEFDKSGMRLEGEALDQNSEAYKKLSEGKEYITTITVDGKEYFGKYKPLLNSSNTTIGAIFVGIPQNEVQKTLVDGLSSLASVFIIIGIVSAVIVIVVSYILARGITKNIIGINNYTKNIMNLDISNDIPKKILNAKDEMGQVAKSLDEAIINLREFMKDTDYLSNNITESSELLLEGINNVAATADEISEVVTQIAQGATTQAKETENGVSKVVMLGSKIEESMNLIEVLNNYMKNVDGLKKEGIEAVTKLSNESKNSNNAAQEIHNVIVDTNNKAKEIAKASKMIKDISEQTNLLALNAAIEAARAGDSGKGFSVVAEQVRTLAEESSKFTEEINASIKALTDRTEDAVTTIESMVKIINEQNREVEITTSKFEGISSSVEESIATLETLNSTSLKMEEEKNYVIDIMENLSAIAEENAASTEEASASVEEQTCTINKFSGRVNSMSKLTQDMKKNLNKFKY